MATHDMNLANQSGASFRSDLNNALAAILSNNSNASSPSTTVAYMLWADTSANKLKIRNSANDAWIDLINLDGTIARDLTLTGASANIVFDQSANELQFADTVKAVFGNGSDLTIHHNGSNSIINDSGAGELLLQRAGNTILSLKPDGIDITDPNGNSVITIKGFENSDAVLGLQADEGDDNGDGWRLVSVASDNDFILTNNIDGSNAQKWAINTSGDVEQQGHLSLPDSKKIKLGAAGDLTIEHDGNNSIINDNGTGELQLQRAGITLLALNSAGVEVKSPSGACEFKVTGNEGAAAKIVLQADEGDDNADVWQIAVPSSDNKFGIRSNSTGSIVELFTIDTTGNVGIGDNDPDQKLCVEGSGTTILKIQNTDDGTAQLTLGNTGSSNLNLQQVGGDTKFAIGGNTRMILTEAGRLHIGDSSTQIQTEQRLSIETTDLAIAAFHKDGTGANNILDLKHGRATGSMQGNMIVFRDSNGTNEGAITTSGSTTLFTNNSDYRLKENIVEITNAITRFKQLKPSRFNFKANPDETVDGFLAHEVALIVPEAVVGTKDAVITQALIDSGDAPDGNLGDPIHQQMDMTRIVPLLTAALQESISKIETLETKVAALEAA